MENSKKSKNPFINMAQEARNKNPLANKPQAKNFGPKANKGFTAPTVVRRSGRGG